MSMSIKGTTPHRSRITAFNRRRFRGSGATSSGVSWIAPAFLRSAILNQVRLLPPRASFSADSPASISERSWVDEHAVRRAIVADYLVHNGRPGSPDGDHTLIVHASCRREYHNRQHRRPALRPEPPSRLA
ncbi:hypothetical protein GCM10029978_065550 [Actinoallomurus acanthiterrae]